MGCDEVTTMEFGEEKDSYQTNDVCRRVVKGLLQTDLNFKDSVIYSQQELDDKLRLFIPTKIPKANPGDIEYNTKDDILTKSLSINFDEECLLAINGVNRILKVEEVDGNYMIFHDNQPGSLGKYIALVVKKIGPEAKICYYSPKSPALD